MSIKIKVTQEHIDKGKPANCSFCPIALAISKNFPGEYVVVGPYGATVADGLALTKNYSVPQSAANFIRDFDKGLPVAPFEFEMEKW